MSTPRESLRNFSHSWHACKPESLSLSRNRAGESLQQLRRRQRCVVHRRGERFRPDTSPLARIVRPALLVLVILVVVSALLWTLLLRVRSPAVHAECPPDHATDSVALVSTPPASQPVRRAPRPSEEECATTAAAVEQSPSGKPTRRCLREQCTSRATGHTKVTGMAESVLADLALGLS